MTAEKIKKALDDFENDNFMDSKDTLRKEIRKKVNDYLKKEADLEKTVDNNPEEDEEEEEELD